MSNSLKQAVTRSPQNTLTRGESDMLSSKSTFRNRMTGEIEDSALGKRSQLEKDRVLLFFRPEWKQRDGRFLGRLPAFLNFDSVNDRLLDTVTRWLDDRFDDVEGTSVAGLANKFGITFNQAMALTLELVASGEVRRVPPFSTGNGVPVYWIAYDENARPSKTAKADHVEVADLSVSEAKQFFRSIEDAETAGLKEATRLQLDRANEERILKAVEEVVERVVQKVLRAILAEAEDEQRPRKKKPLPTKKKTRTR